MFFLHELARINGLIKSIDALVVPIIDARDVPIIKIDKFKIGDLVYWFTWQEHEGSDIETIIHRGVLVDILHQKFGEREVSMAKVLPYGSQETILINITLIRKSN